jgi:RNA polymerase sigma factor (sigma-70 family)
MPDMDDATLVARSRAGDADAFAQIVARYQALICALTFSATGRQSQSEDLAQETFVIAWKKLGELREPEKLRAWLCGIARNLCLNLHRENRREPTHEAELLENIHDKATETPDPAMLAMQGDEETIVWRALEQLPEIYREPLVLYYRQHKSIEHVAVELELNEEVVRQRLSRGRKMLSERVEAVVEGTLARSNPGQKFTLNVMAALPTGLAAGKAASATTGATATTVKGLTMAKGGLLGFGLGAVLGPLAGLLSAWLGLKTSVENSQSSAERAMKIKMGRGVIILVLGVLLGQYLIFAISNLFNLSAELSNGLTIGVWVVYAVAIVVCSYRGGVSLRQIMQGQQRQIATSKYFRQYEYRSQCRLLGLPLVHINYGAGANGAGSTARGWLAFGDKAVGFVSIGGVSLGFLSIGGLAGGVIALGGLACGPVAMGGLAIGGWAVGGVVLGYDAIGGAAMAWQGAYGGSAIAHEFATGGSASAQHANDAAAQFFMNHQSFFARKETILNSTLGATMLLTIVIIGRGLQIFSRKKTSTNQPMTMAEFLGRPAKKD